MDDDETEVNTPCENECLGNMSGEDNLEEKIDDFYLSQSEDMTTMAHSTFKLRHLHEQFLDNLPMFDFFAENFYFSLSRNEQLTNSEVHELYELYEVSRCDRVGDRGYTLTVASQEDEIIKKCSLLFIRETENHRYNLLLCEAQNKTGVNWSRFAAASGAAMGTSFIVSLFNPIVGGISFATSGIALVGKYLNDSTQHHQYQNLVIGYMISELEKNNVLVFRDSQCFLREGGQLICITTLDYAEVV